MTRVATLWHLQTIDQELDDKTKRARQVDDLLTDAPTVATARAALDSEQKHLADLRATLRARELDAKSLDAKIKEIESRLYGGRVTNPKELDALEKDRQMHLRQRGELDTVLLELMDALEQADARVNERSRALKQAETERASEIERLTRERDMLAARLAELAEERERMRGTVDADALRAYDHLRAKAGRALAQLRHNACGACGVATPTALVSRVHAGAEIIYCPGCGRILAA